MAQGMAYQAGMKYLAGGLPRLKTMRLVRWGGKFLEWTGSYYRPAAEETVKADVTRWLARHLTVRTDLRGVIKPVTENFVRDVMLAVRAEAEIPESVQSGTWIKGPPPGTVGPFLAVPNGIIDLGRLNDPAAMPLSSDPDFFTLSALPVVPDGAATPARWRQFLVETFGDGAAVIRLLQEACGYCLWPDCRYEKLFILHGQGNSGKSTIVETLQAMLGEPNVSAISLERLGGRFDLSGLIGKMANIIFDASEIDRTAEGTLKALISGEPVPVEEKHLAIRTLRLTAKHFIVANILPRFHDTTDGIWRRIELIPFENVCPPERRDPSLKSLLKDELPAIAHWAIEGLARLRAQDGFSPFDRGNNLIADYRRESNPVALFLEGHCTVDPHGRVGRQALYAAYRFWAVESGFSPLSVTRFNRELRALHPQPQQVIRDGRGGDRMFVGLRLEKDRGVMADFAALARN